MSTIDLYADGFPHGTRAGYEQGCKGDALCRSVADTAQTCREAHSRFGSDWRYSQFVKAGMGELEAVALIAEQQKAAERSAAVTSKPKARVRKPAPEKRSYERREPLESSTFPHGTEKGWKWGCREECPAERSCVVAHREANAKYQRDRYARQMADRPARDPREPRVHTPALRQDGSPRKSNVKHGTQWGAMNGCVSETECPNVAAGGISCIEAKRRYHRDYAARRRATAGATPKQHGTPTGYSMGCKDSASCPSKLAGGLSCREAANAYEVSRRRARGVSEARKAQHGTRGGYRSLKCRLRDQCPSALAGGPSCTDAAMAYLKLQNSKRDAA